MTIFVFYRKLQSYSKAIGGSLMRISYPAFFILFLLAHLIKSYLVFLFFTYLLGDYSQTRVGGGSLDWERLLYVCLVFPVLETVFFQVVLLKLFKRLTGSVCWGIVISAFLFGLAHYTNVYYQTTVLLSGILYGLSFVIAEIRMNSAWKACLIVSGIHIVYNILSTVINQWQ